eukprot:UN28047
MVHVKKVKYGNNRFGEIEVVDLNMAHHIRQIQFFLNSYFRHELLC